MWLSISSSSSWSLRCLLNKPQNLKTNSRTFLMWVSVRIFRTVLIWETHKTKERKNCSSCDLRVQKARKNGGGLLPFLGFLLNLFAAGSRELVKLRLPIVVRKTPFGTDVSLLFQLEQRRIEGPIID